MMNLRFGPKPTSASRQVDLNPKVNRKLANERVKWRAQIVFDDDDRNNNNNIFANRLNGYQSIMGSACFLQRIGCWPTPPPPPPLQIGQFATQYWSPLIKTGSRMWTTPNNKDSKKPRQKLSAATAVKQTIVAGNSEEALGQWPVVNHEQISCCLEATIEQLILRE